jgi:hypothetical protein
MSQMNSKTFLIRILKKSTIVNIFLKCTKLNAKIFLLKLFEELFSSHSNEVMGRFINTITLQTIKGFMFGAYNLIIIFFVLAHFS